MENLMDSLSGSQILDFTPEQLTAAQQTYLDITNKQRLTVASETEKQKAKRLKHERKEKKLKNIAKEKERSIK